MEELYMPYEKDPEGKSLQCNNLLRTTELTKVNTISYKNSKVKYILHSKYSVKYIISKMQQSR